MSDIKRVVLTTLEPQKVNEKLVKKHCKTVRICVALPESNEDKCPEYNYKDEVAAVKKRVKQNPTKETNNAPNGLDPLDNDNDDDVRRIALEMEAKYGSGVTGESKKKRKDRKDDYADIGAGYDETDSFIYNTDGYDEIIPANVTTVRGGFYINSGALEFKTNNEATSEISSSSSDEDSESEEEENGNKPKRKRALDTTDEEDAASDNSSQGQEEKKPVVDKPNISMHQAIKKKLFSHDKIQVKKRRLAEEQKKTVKDLLDEKRSEFVISENVEKDSLKENKKPMKLSSVDDAIESVINRTDKSQKSSEISESKVQVTKKDENHRPGDQPSSSMESETTSDPMKIEIIKLPENLPTDILEIIENIKKSARDYKDGGKVKFFSGEVNVMLLNLERKCKVLGRSSRVKVYEHLAPFVRCRKETLIKRAKNLVMEEEHKKLKKTIEKLKNGIDQLMPSLMTNHEKECQKILQKKFSHEAANNEELKNLKAPRRRFPLSEDMRRMIRDIVSFKKRCLLHEGKQKDSLEDLLTEYLKKEILVLWPDGWMSMTVLKKFCTTTAIKTPDPKNLGSNINSNKHSHKPQTSSTTSTIINFSSGNNLTITPVNLTEKLNEVSNNNVSPSSEPDTIIKPIKEKVIEIHHETIIKPIINENVLDKQIETVMKPLNKDRSDKQKETKDNGVIVINTTKTKEDPVIPKATHCQVIDLTDAPHIPSIGKSIEDTSPPFLFAKDLTDTKLNANFGSTIKNKFSGISVTTNTHDRDDVQKVMESLKALQKLSSPSKNETTSSPVSVIAFNKNYSNSNSSQTTSVVSNERTNFSGAIGFQDEFQKQFIGSLNNHKSSSPPSKSSYNRCS